VTRLGMTKGITKLSERELELVVLARLIRLECLAIRARAKSLLADHPQSEIAALLKDVADAIMEIGRRCAILVAEQFAELRTKGSLLEEADMVSIEDLKMILEELQRLAAGQRRLAAESDAVDGTVQPRKRLRRRIH